MEDAAKHSAHLTHVQEGRGAPFSSCVLPCARGQGRKPGDARRACGPGLSTQRSKTRMRRDAPPALRSGRRMRSACTCLLGCGGHRRSAAARALPGLPHNLRLCQAAGWHGLALRITPRDIHASCTQLCAVTACEPTLRALPLWPEAARIIPDYAQRNRTRTRCKRP
jgi:hypothetical protein